MPARTRSRPTRSATDGLPSLNWIGSDKCLPFLVSIPQHLADELAANCEALADRPSRLEVLFVGELDDEWPLTEESLVDRSDGCSRIARRIAASRHAPDDTSASHNKPPVCQSSLRLACRPLPTDGRVPDPQFPVTAAADDPHPVRAVGHARHHGATRLDLLRGRCFSFPQGQGKIAAVPSDLIRRRAPGVERLLRNYNACDGPR